MTIPFLDFFKKKAIKETAGPAAGGPPPSVEKPSSERLSKTVMPNATRIVGPQDPFRAAAGSSPVGLPTISFGASAPASRPGDLPPAVALALEPRVERAISLELTDVVRQMPQGMVRPLETADASRRVLLKASELERGMASGRPSVSVATIYQQVPEIFLRTIAPSDVTQVQLPLQKVVEQFSRLQVRSDQNREQAVPQLQTPFLKVTLEDNARFGTTTEPLQTGDLPPVRLEPATAETLAAAEPEPAASEKFVLAPAATPSPAPIQFPVSTDSNGHGNGSGFSHAPAVPPGRVPASSPAPIPARIPFKLSPKGTDAPAPERVPASSGPSVPTSLPTRIPFKMMPPPEGSGGAKSEPWLTKENFVDPDSPTTLAVSAPASQVENRGEIKIALALKPILLSLPPFHLAGDISLVPEDARIEFPFSLLEPQLASGRVLLSPADFARNLPDEYRGLFNANETTATVLLPLQEVLKNLPTASLRMRDDQIEQEKGENFATPFSAKAEEDAKRFNVAAAPIAKPAIASTAGPVVATAPSVPAKQPAGTRSALQTALDTDDELDAKAVVAHVGRMVGVKACAIMFGDGLSLAGNLPEVYEADGLCAMAPSLLQRVENHMAETKLGALRAITLSCSKAAVTFLMHDNLCLAVLHAKEELTSDVRERLMHVVHELSRKYSNSV